MLEFAQWLAQTQISLAIQSHLWVVPTVQSIHIVAIGVVVGAVFIMNLRILGMAWLDQSMMQTTDRFAPWLWTAMVVLLLTGAIMIVGEPVRELLSLSFWLKMTLIAIGTGFAIAFQASLRRQGPRWENTHSNRKSTQALAVLTLAVWCSVIILGRLIAYDHVWGSWSLQPLT
jgi:hypothetical protein